MTLRLKNILRLLDFVLPPAQAGTSVASQITLVASCTVRRGWDPMSGSNELTTHYCLRTHLSFMSKRDLLRLNTS